MLTDLAPKSEPFLPITCLRFVLVLTCSARPLLMMLCLALLAGCIIPTDTNSQSTRVELNGETMGTTYSVKLVPRTGNLIADVGLQAEIDQRLEMLNNQMSTWRPESELSRFNASRSTDWFAVSPATAKVCLTAKEISAATDGAFDVTVGPLVNLWNFGPEEFAEKVPSDNLLAKTAQHVGDDKFEVRLDPPALRKSDPELYVDLSAIAKGYGVDVIADHLESIGYQDYMVEIGGEIRTRGHRLDGGPWRVAVETPTDNQRDIQTVLEFNQAALATSGDYRNFFIVDGRRFSHTIDPRTGKPIEHELASVSVVADSCMKADAWATALMVLGPKAGYNLAVENELATLMIVRQDGKFVERASPEFDKYRDQLPVEEISP